MAEFQKAFDFVMNNEDSTRSGAVTNEPGGGIAKYGINSKAHPEVDVANLTLAGATALFQEWYWVPIHGDVITDQDVADKLLDIAINLGTHRAGLYCQQALNAQGCNLKEDSHIGPQTIAALNGANQDQVLTQLRFLQAQHYRERAAEDPDIAKILKALLVRAAK